MLLGNLLKAAAPELAAQMSEIAVTVVAFAERLKSVEQQNNLILEKLEQIQNGRIGKDHQILAGTERANPATLNGG